MSYDDKYNTDFFGYTGTINRKNYALNMLILFGLFVVVSLFDFVNLKNLINIPFLETVIDFMLSLFKFVIFFSAVSLVFRRFSDIAENKSQKFKDLTIKFFGVFYGLPVLYFLCIRYFFDIFPALITFVDTVMIFALVPVALITAFVVSFVKGR